MSVVETATETARQWTITTTNQAKVTGYLPPWADTDPSQDDVRPGMLHIELEDIAHTRRWEGMQLDVHFYSEDAATAGADGVLVPRITVEPHSQNPASRVPTVCVAVLAGISEEIEGLDPHGVMALADKLREHADLLDDVAAHLSDARDDWAKNGGTR